MTTGLQARRRRWRPLAVGVAVILLTAAILIWRTRSESVTGVAPERRDVVRTLVLTGRVGPSTRPQVGATASGRVVQLLVREGDHVSAGQLLARIDDSQQTAMLAEARASLSSAAARARSTLEQAELVAHTTDRDAGRARVLFTQGAISERDLQEAELTASSAKAELDAARATAGGTATAPLADVARARAAVEAADAQLALTRINAPAAGRVLTRIVEPGDAVLQGQLLLELQLDGATELVAFAREENLAELKIGAVATASADAFPDSTFPSRVSWLAPLIDRNQGTVEVRLSVPAPPDYLRADMTISVNVEVARRSGALVVPRDLVRGIESGAPWLMVATDDRAERRPVKVGVTGDRYVEILDGLSAKERVLPTSTAVGARVRVVRSRASSGQAAGNASMSTSTPTRDSL